MLWTHPKNVFQLLSLSYYQLGATWLTEACAQTNIEAFNSVPMKVIESWKKKNLVILFRPTLPLPKNVHQYIRTGCQAWLPVRNSRRQRWISQAKTSLEQLQRKMLLSCQISLTQKCNSNKLKQSCRNMFPVSFATRATTVSQDQGDPGCCGHLTAGSNTRREQAPKLVFRYYVILETIPSPFSIYSSALQVRI